jgi:hypothetical protein
MATTTNYGWDTPDDTDLVKDGALAIRDLGQDVDTQLFTALGGDYPGLRLIKKQTIGTSVASVTVTDAFSATYDAYKIIVTGGSGTNVVGQLRLGATITNYRVTFAYGNFGAGGQIQNLGGTAETSFVYAGNFTADGLRMNCDLINPFLAKTTQVTAGYAGGGLAGTMNGELLNTTSYTDFNLTMQGGGTFTGGTIYVYGYGAS